MILSSIGSLVVRVLGYRLVGMGSTPGQAYDCFRVGGWWCGNVSIKF